MNSMISLSFPQLSSDNFNNWKFRVKTLLDEKQVAHTLETTVDQIEDEKDKQSFLVCDAKAKATIVQCLTDKHLDLVKDSKTAKDMMTVLENVFERKSTFSKLYLKRKLLSLKCSPNDKLEDHFLKFDQLIRELESVGSKLDESDKVCHLLLTMSSNYDPVITAIETIQNDLTVEFVKSRLLDEELKLKNKCSLIKTNSNTSEVSFHVKNEMKCYGCGKTNHKYVDCWHRNNRGRGSRGRVAFKRGQYVKNKNENAHHATNMNEANDNVTFVAHHCVREENTNNFIVDSGATEHLVKGELEPYMTNVLNLPKKIIIKTANGENMIAEKSGTFVGICQGIRIDFKALIVSQMKHNLISVAKLAEKGLEVIFRGNSLSIKRGTTVISTKKGEDNLYKLKINPGEVKSNNVSGLTAATDADLWHRRLGHLNRKGMKKLGLPTSNKICGTCVEGKLTRKTFVKTEKKSRKIGDLIHSDLCGPITQITNEGHKYFQVLIDDFSHFLIVKLLKQKSEAEENIKEFIALIKTQHGENTRRIRLDNGGEFTSNDFKTFCSTKGIRLEYTTPYTPQQNGTSERMNRTLLNKVRTKFAETNLPRHLWGEAVQCSAYELNRSPTSANGGIPPAKLWYGRNDLSKLKVFGSTAWALTLPKKCKLEPTARKMVMVGYSGGGYRLWDPIEDKIVLSCDVKFDENVIKYTNNKENQTIGIINDEDTSLNENIEETEVEMDEIENFENEKQRQKSKREIRRPKHLDEFEVYTAYCLLSSENDPVSYKEAMEEEEWMEAIEKELDSHEKLQTWTPCKLPPNKKAIGTKWVFRTKEDGTKKARLVAKGFQVKEEDSLNFMYAPVARMSTIRTLLSQAVQNDWNIRQLDIPTAFLNGNVESDIYIKPPEGMNADKNTVLKLNRALYGLKESPKCWNNRFNEVLEGNGFTRSKYDFCFYYKNNGWMIVYVDDLIVTGNDEDIEEIVNMLRKEFNAKDMGNISNFLGMEILRNDQTLKIKQPRQIKKILEMFNMNDCKTCSTPMEIGFQIDPKEEVIDVPYRQLIGSLMYLATTSRPDLMFCVSYLSRSLDKPSRQTWNAAKRVLKYLRSTSDTGLEYKKGGEMLKAYSDADWAGDKTDRKSVSGCIVFCNGNPVSWFSKKQNCVALSTAEAEYIAGATSAQELLNVKGILSHFKVQSTPVLYMDNISGISMAKTYENSKRGKHIDIRHHFIKDLIAKQEIKIHYVKTEDNVADMMTKPLGKEKLQKLKREARIV